MVQLASWRGHLVDPWLAQPLELRDHLLEEYTKGICMYVLNILRCSSREKFMFVYCYVRL